MLPRNTYDRIRDNTAKIAKELAFTGIVGMAQSAENDFVRGHLISAWDDRGQTKDGAQRRIISSLGYAFGRLDEEDLYFVSLLAACFCRILDHIAADCKADEDYAFHAAIRAYTHESVQAYIARCPFRGCRSDEQDCRQRLAVLEKRLRRLVEITGAVAKRKWDRGMAQDREEERLARRRGRR